MKQRRIVLALAYPLLAFFAVLVLLRNVRVIGWESGRLREKSEHEAQAGTGTRGITGGISRFRPWRSAVGARSFLARRDASGEHEWMDLPGNDPRELAEMFKDLRRVNRWLGGGWMTVRGLNRLIDDHATDEQITILDVASGSVDIPRVIAQWAHRRGHKLSIIATDINPEVLKLARETGSPGAVQLVAADALCLPFADDAFDVAACSFFLHHLDPDDVVVALREMRRVSRDGVLINDMLRSWISYLGACTLSRVFTRNRISRHDAPLSARRSYTRAELVELAARAGLEPVATYSFFGYRVVMVTADRRSAPETMTRGAPVVSVPAG